MADKAQYVAQLRTSTTQLGAIIAQLRDYRQVYFDRGYGSGGSDPIVQADLPPGITPGEIAAVINMAGALENFVTGQAVAQDAWGKVINDVRTDV